MPEPTLAFIVPVERNQIGGGPIIPPDSGNSPSHPIVLPEPPTGVFPPPVPAHPIVIAPPGTPPGVIWPPVGGPPHPDQGLPGSQPHPDQGLPVPPPVTGGGAPPVPTHPIAKPPVAPTHPISGVYWVIVWVPGYGWKYVTVAPGLHPDNTLPGSQPHPDQGLPTPPTGSPPHPDQGLPAQPPSTPTPTPQRR